MAAQHRKGPRNRQHANSLTILWTASGAGLIFTLCLCAFNLDLNANSSHSRLDMCRSTCDERLQTAALESTVSSSSHSPPVMSTFLSRGADQHSAFHGRASDGSHTNLKTAQQQAVSGRPRRLPTLIKILTGFGDEPYWNDQSSSSSDSAGGNKPIIAKMESPQFVHQAQRRRGADTEPLSHEETVQIAAAAAAASLWSKSIRIFGHHRMQRVNSEWDAALRWVAGWDQQQHMPSPSSPNGGSNSEPIRSNDNGPLHGGVSNDARREGYNTFVDDLAMMLETCISQCVEDENFESRLGNDEGPGGEVAMGGFSVARDLVLRSLFGWVIGLSFSKISFGKLDMISSESRFIIARAFQLVASSVAMFALHSLWSWAFPVVSHWYSSFGYTESPEWLLQHEKEIERTKTSRSRQRKKAKRRQLTRKKPAPNNDGMQKKSRIVKGTSDKDFTEPTRSANHDASAQDPGMIRGKLSGVSISEDWQKESALENAVPTSKDSVSGSQGSCTTESVPSMISYPSTSASSSPSMKPIGSHLEDRDIPYVAPLPLQGTSQPLLGLNSQVVPQNPLFPQLLQQMALPVPTQEQRNEAAKQLREFQNAQIQRLLYQRKLSQISNESSLSPTMTPQSSGLLHGVSFHSAGPSFTISSGLRNKVLKPPPGLTHPSELSESHDLHSQDDKGFLAGNELILSKLLDDDDDDIAEAPSPSPQIGIGSMSPEPSSLDPSAAPFVFEKARGGEQAPLFSKTKDEKKDAWQSSPGEISLKANSPARMMKGVYGGSVW